MATHGVDLVDEDDARRVLLALLEEVADPACADAYEHLDEVGPRDAEEAEPPPRPRWPGRGASCPCREGQSRALPWGCGRRDAGTSWGSFQERDDLFDLALGLSRCRRRHKRSPGCSESLSRRALALPNDMALPPPACSCLMKRKNIPPMKSIGRRVTRVDDQKGVLSSSRSKS